MNYIFSEEIKKTTASLVKNDFFIGSGVLFRLEGELFVITAAHVLFGSDMDEECRIDDWHIQDYLGNNHRIKSISEDIRFCKENDIILINLMCSAIVADFITPIFSGLPSDKEQRFFFRGRYNLKKEPVNKHNIRFEESYQRSRFQFICEIDKGQLVNSNFAYGSEWLTGSSGSGLFYDDKKDIICVGILLAIPDKGDNGQLLFCGVAALKMLGLGVEIFEADIFRYNYDILTEDWFKLKLKATINALGTRYSPTLNFALPIAQTFDYLEKDNSINKFLTKYLDQINLKSERFINIFRQIAHLENVDLLKTDFEKLNSCVLTMYASKGSKVSYRFFLDLCESTISKLEELSGHLNRKQRSLENSLENSLVAIDGMSLSRADLIKELESLKGTLSEIKSAMNGDRVRLSNNPCIILVGDAGMGKSHLLADIALKRQEEGKLTLFLLGQHFVSEQDPWYQILETQLHLDVNELDFLGMLNAKAQLSGSRIIIIIDAINEGNGKNIWPSSLKTFIETINRYEWIGIVFSVRTTYHDLLVENSIYLEQLAERKRHLGFTNREQAAADFFFANYGITKPRIPFLHPEYRSPLFLTLFCQGLSANGLSEVPEGYEGISTILDYYLGGINRKLSFQYGYSSSINLVRRSVEALAYEMIKNDLSYISYQTAVYFFNDLDELRILTQKSSFVDSLVHEGVLSKNIYLQENKKNEEGLYFAYEKFFDHMVAACLIHYMDESSERYITFTEKLSKYFTGEELCKQNLGLIEALSVQLPENFDLEFFDVFPEIASFKVVATAFVESITWRKHDSFKGKNSAKMFTGRTKEDRLTNYINDVVYYKNGMLIFFIESILLVTTIPGHFFNANYLHNLFIKLTLAERDALFLPWVAGNYHKPIRGQPVASPLTKLIKWGLNDDQNATAPDDRVLLGCVTLSWGLISANRYLRDEITKSIICLLEFKEHLIVDLLRTFERVNDPYVSERLYGVAYGCALRAEQFAFLNELCAYIYDQVFNKKDVVPNLRLREYAGGVIGFANKNNISFSFGLVSTYPRFKSPPVNDFPTQTYITDHYQLSREDSRYFIYQNAILKSMNVHYGDFGKYVFRRLLENWRVNVEKLSNFAILRIFELGYDVELHGQYDSELECHWEDGNERIGKKYQRIVLQEILARVADNCFVKNRFSGWLPLSTVYKGPWKLDNRDIDLSIIIKKTNRIEGPIFKSARHFWWLKAGRIDWGLDNDLWIKTADDLPIIEEVIGLTDPDGVDWLCLEIMPEWEEQEPLYMTKISGPSKRICLKIRSYLVPENEFEQFEEWAKNQDFYSRWMPESTPETALFSREYYWSDAYWSSPVTLNGGIKFHKIYDRDSGGYIADIHIPVEQTHWECNLDCSKEQTIKFYRPSALLWKEMPLKYSGDEGEFNDGNGHKICFDPSVRSQGQSCLLVQKDTLVHFLNRKKLRLCWTITGEKEVLGAKQYHSGSPLVQHKINGFYSLKNELISGNVKSDIKKS